MLPTLPAPSRAATLTCTWRVASASRSEPATLTLKLPLACTVPLVVTPLTVTLTTSPVRNSPVTVPVIATLPAPSAALTTLSAVTSLTVTVVVCALGAWVSTVMSKAALGSLSLPAASVCVSVSACGPSLSGLVVTLQVPSALTTALPTTTSPS